MVNSVVGKMGRAAAEACVRAGLELASESLAGARDAAQVSSVEVGTRRVRLVPPISHAEAVAEAAARQPGLVAIDYTLPTAVNANALLYAESGVPFVMGTTGGDRARLAKDLKRLGAYAVVAPNMGKQIVALQTMLARAARDFPGSFADYRLEVTESHQASKADPSGTGLAVVDLLRGLGVQPFRDADMVCIRGSEAARERMGVPESALGGHAFHTYRLISPDGSVAIEFRHNVAGHRVYAEGSVDATIFLAQRVREKDDKKIYSMVDVLEAGAMR